MKRIAIAVAPLAALGAACAKAEPKSPRPRSSNGEAKAAIVEAGLTSFTGSTSK